ncbi:MAG: SCO family protein [Acidimicrobiia bacterium]
MHHRTRLPQGHLTTRPTRSLAVFAALLILTAACSGADAADEPDVVAAIAEASAEFAAATLDADGSPFLHRPIDRVAPAFTLTDQKGEEVSLSDFAGKWVVVDWVFTNCTTFCPLLTGQMNQVHRGLGDAVGDEIQMITISFDPVRDTPQALLDHSSRVTGGAEGWSWLTGTSEQTDAVAADYGVSFDPSDAVAGIAQFDHTALMVVIGPDGREKHRYLGTGWSDDVLERLNTEALGLAPPPAVVAAEPVAEPAEVSADVAELLAPAIALPWEEFELEPGVTSQVMYQFPSQGQMLTYVDTVGEDAISQGVEVKRLELSAMKVRLVKWADDRAVGIGYDTNLAVTVEGESSRAVLDALGVLDSEWCCGTAGD